MANPRTPDRQSAGAFAYSGPNGFLDAKYDLASGRIDASGKGFWEHDVAAAYFRDWATMVKAMHQADRSLRALVDLREAAIQTMDVTAFIKACGDLHGGDDRIALIVPSALMTLQMRRALGSDCHRFFTREDLATAWIVEASSDLTDAA